MQNHFLSDSDIASRMSAFDTFVRAHLHGDEKGEAQIFCDRLFQAFGHQGIFEAGGTLEFRIRNNSKTQFADLLWRPRVLLEMKKRGEPLQRHYQQALDYWLHLVPDRPQYVVLCNFDEFWIYDLNRQLDEPMDRVARVDLPERFTALSFLFPHERRPLFNNDRVVVTRTAAAKVASVFNHLVHRPDAPVTRDRAQRFILQSVIALFAEDALLIPKGLFYELLDESANRGNSYDLLGGLFRQMATASPADGGRYRSVPYFNGGLFSVVQPVELTGDDIGMLRDAAEENWSKVHPAVFGSLFEGSMDQEERHAFGAHYTSEVDIYKVVLPTIVRPWREQIENARTVAELEHLRARLLSYRVLDPACGSGNFLYVAYRELKRIEFALLDALYAKRGKRARRGLRGSSRVSATQFFGIDVKPFAVELAKVTLMLGKVLALREAVDRLAAEQHDFDIGEEPLPLDNLDANFRTEDALIASDGSPTPWPHADAIIGNPPFLGAKRLKPFRGSNYVNLLRRAYKNVPGMADYCVYWFRRSHEHLPACTAADPVAGRAGLVGTQNIRNNQSRVGGLDTITSSGTIVEAVDNQPWSGEANVHVSIVNWIKQPDEVCLPPIKRLWSLTDPSGTRRGSGKGVVNPAVPYTLTFREVDLINSSLSDRADISSRQRLASNVLPKRCFQGKIPGYEGFLVNSIEAEEMAVDSSQVLFPYLTGRELLDKFEITRWVIDFGNRNLAEASAYPSAFDRVRTKVLPAVTSSFEEVERTGSDMAAARQEHLNRWWQLWNRRDELTRYLRTTRRYIGCSRVTRRPVMVFLDSYICPSDLVQVFAFDDDYAFGVLQSSLHFEWFRTSSKLKVESDSRYSVREVFETFPWPQQPGVSHVDAVAEAGRTVRRVRAEILANAGGGLRDVYRVLELPGNHPLRDAHRALDEAVFAAYGTPYTASALQFLLDLNEEIAASIKHGHRVEGPGLPSFISDSSPYVSNDCYTNQELR